MALADLANPSRFLTFANRAIPWLGGVTVIAFAFGLNQAMGAPDDYQQGATVKIMFLHVPSAWLGMLGWGLMTIAALGTLVWRHPLADVAAKAAAPIGAAFTLLCLVTGSLWGRPSGAPTGCGTRGSPRSWSCSCSISASSRCGARSRTPRARRAPPRSSRSSAPSICRSSSSRSIGGTRCIKPASVFRLGGPTIDPTILIPLLIMAVAFTLAVRDAASRRDAQRNSAPPRAHAAADAGERGELTMQATSHIAFIVASYAAAFAVVGGLIAWVMLDFRAQRRALADLEMRGLTRRSASVRSERDDGGGEGGSMTAVANQSTNVRRRRRRRAGAARRFSRAGCPLSVRPQRRRSLAHPLGAHRPSGAAHDPAAHFRPRSRRRTRSRDRCGELQGRRDGRECLGVVVRAVPRRGAGAHAIGAGQPLSPDRPQLQGPAGRCPAFPRPLRKSVRGRGRRREWPRRDRMGRLWRAGNVCRRPRCPHRLQAGRADYPRQFRLGAQARRSRKRLPPPPPYPPPQAGEGREGATPAPAPVRPRISSRAALAARRTGKSAASRRTP